MSFYFMCWTCTAIKFGSFKLGLKQALFEVHFDLNIISQTTFKSHRYTEDSVFQNILNTGTVKTEYLISQSCLTLQCGVSYQGHIVSSQAAARNPYTIVFTVLENPRENMMILSMSTFL